MGNAISLRGSGFAGGAAGGTLGTFSHAAPDRCPGALLLTPSAVTANVRLMPTAPRPSSLPRPVTDPRTGRRTDGGPELDLLALLARLQDSFAAEAAAADAEAPVPACGLWRVRDLVAHLAGVHHWAAGMALGDASRSEVLDTAGRGLADLYAEHAAELRAALRTAGPDGPARTLLGAGPASFWHRRQVHETLVHLHDLRAAALGSGLAVAAERPIDVGPEVWADTVDEVATMFQPRQVRLGRMEPLARTLGLSAPDVGRSWVLGAHEDGRDLAEAPAATVVAPARELALVLWRRLTPQEAGVEIDGDASALGEVLAERIVP